MLSNLLFGIHVSWPGLLIEFATCSTLLLWFATRLSHYADALERETGTSAIWIGMIFLAIVTSIPEAVASIGAALMEGALNLGAGNLFGSCTFNLSIIILLDVMQGRGPLLALLKPSLRNGAKGGIIMLGMVGVSVALHHTVIPAAAAGWTGVVSSLLIFVAYVLLSRWTAREVPSEEVTEVLAASEPVAAPRGKPRIIAGLAFFSLLLIVDATWLLRVCDTISVFPMHFGEREIILGRTVTGTFVLSMATSFPELFVSIAAFRLGQTNMAIANILGSNMANMLFIPVMHIVSREPAFYSMFEPSGLVVVVTAILMSVIFIVGLRSKSKKPFLSMGWETGSMLVVYLLGAFLVLKMGLRF